jgi:hypothetical protein
MKCFKPMADYDQTFRFWSMLKAQDFLQSSLIIGIATEAETRFRCIRNNAAKT